MAFEDYNTGLVKFFNVLAEAKAWAKEQRAKNKDLLTPSKKKELKTNYENIIYVDIVNINSKGFYDLVDTVWDCPLF